MSDISHFTSSESDEWATPPQFVRPIADAVDGFDLDAASGAENSPIAETAYTEDDDGLRSEWFGTVWCNPPYSEMDSWTEKAISASLSDTTDEIVYLVKGDSSTTWWQHAAEYASAISFVDHRLSFGDAGGAPFCSHVFVFGTPPDDLLNVLSNHGIVATDVYTATTQVTL